MNLRPHHLLCIQKFTGHGYDDSFTEHMTGIVSTLRLDPETPVTVTEGCDILCGMCPYNKNGVCESLEKVDFMDRSVLAVCGLSYGECVTWQKLAFEARTKIFETEAFQATCSACQWYELCRKTEVYNGQD